MTHNVISFRKAAEQDYPLLFEIEKKTFIRNFDITFPTLQAFRKFFLDKPYQLSIITYKNIPVGSFFLSVTSNAIDIEGITILPEYQNKGIGTYTVKNILNRHPDVLFRLVTHPENYPAIKLYYNTGFTVVGYKENYYGDGQPRLILERKPQ